MADAIAEMRSDWIYRAAQGLVFLKITLLVLVFDPSSFDTFTLPKSVASHATSYVLAALLVVLVLRYGRAALTWSPIHAFVGGLVLAFAIATVFALDPIVALYGIWKRYLGLAQLLDDALLFLAVSLLFRRPSELGRLLTVAMTAAVVVLAYGLVQRAGLDPVTFRDPITSREATTASTRLTLTTFGHHDITSGYLSIAGATAFGASFLLWSRIGPVARLALLLIGVGCVGELFITNVRNGVLGLAGGWLAIVAIVVVRGGRRWPALLAAGVTGIAVMLGILLSPIAPRLTLEAMRSDLAVLSRIAIWDGSRALIASHPLFGVGPDNFGVAYEAARDRPTSEALLQNSTHNWFLYVATSAGLVGAAVMLLLLAFSIAAALSRARSGAVASVALVPLAAYLSQGLVNVSEIGIEWILWTSLGIIAGSVAVPIASSARVAWRGALATASGVVVALVALAAVGDQRARLDAGEAMRLSEAYAVSPAARDAPLYGRLAVERDPRRAEYWSTYGTALSAARQPVIASAAFGEATRLAPWHGLYWRNLSITRLQSGDTGGALVAIREATQRDRFDPESHDLYANIAFLRNDFQRAVSEGSTAVALDPRKASAYGPPARAYLELGTAREAEALVRDGLARTDDPFLHVLLAEVYAQSGRVPAALDEIARVLARQPGNAEALALRDRLKQ